MLWKYHLTELAFHEFSVKSINFFIHFPVPDPSAVFHEVIPFIFDQFRISFFIIRLIFFYIDLVTPFISKIIDVADPFVIFKEEINIRIEIIIMISPQIKFSFIIYHNIIRWYMESMKMNVVPVK